MAKMPQTEEELNERDQELLQEIYTVEAELQEALKTHIEPIKERKRALKRERGKLGAVRKILGMSPEQQQVLAEVLQVGKEGN